MAGCGTYDYTSNFQSHPDKLHLDAVEAEIEGESAALQDEYNQIITDVNDFAQRVLLYMRGLDDEQLSLYQDTVLSQNYPATFELALRKYKRAVSFEQWVAYNSLLQDPYHMFFCETKLSIMNQFRSLYHLI